ncbi:MAG TPA: sulfoacetaldehyde dehydrogenase, partial [Paraburkholderia sp.]
MNVRASHTEVGKHGVNAEAGADSSVAEDVAALVGRARVAQREFERAGQQALDMAAAAAAWAIME